MRLQNGIFYGPLFSRRFGRSLGVNLLPASAKACQFDCGYCQYRTEPCGANLFPSIADIAEAAEERFTRAHRSGETFDEIMIAGNGEPTLHPRLAEAFRVLTAARDRHFPEVPIGILSNSFACVRPEVRSALSLLDGRYMKLDAADEELLKRVNRPRAKVRLRSLLDGLRELAPEGIVIQTMFVKGSADNTDQDAVDDWIESVGYVGPKFVQIYTLDRAPQDKSVLPAPAGMLRDIAERLTERTGIHAEAYV